MRRVAVVALAEPRARGAGRDWREIGSGRSRADRSEREKDRRWRRCGVWRAAQLGAPHRDAGARTRERRTSTELERARGRATLLAGEVELDRRRASAVQHGGFRAVRGLGARAGARPSWQARLRELGASLIELRTAARQAAADAARPRRRPSRSGRCSTTYGAVPYEDVDPTPFVALTYCLMFGMMFGDVGDGLLIVLGALALRRARSPRLRRCGGCGR